jgi:cellulase/cellobiase CelA1
VSVRANTALPNWMVHFNFQGSQTINQAWNGKYSAMGNAVMLEPADWNRQLAAGGTATIGFIGTGAAPTVTGLECMLA